MTTVPFDSDAGVMISFLIDNLEFVKEFDAREAAMEAAIMKLFPTENSAESGEIAIDIEPEHREIAVHILRDFAEQADGTAREHQEMTDQGEDPPCTPAGCRAAASACRYGWLPRRGERLPLRRRPHRARCAVLRRRPYRRSGAQGGRRHRRRSAPRQREPAMGLVDGDQAHRRPRRGTAGSWCAVKAGRIVVLTKCSSFKLAIVLGQSRVAGKLRVQTYSHAARGWSNPHTVLEGDTRTAAVGAMQGGQRRTLLHAILDGEHLGAWCHTA